MNVTISLTDAQVRGMELVRNNKSNEDVVKATVSSALRSKLKYYRDGSVCDADVSTHSIELNGKTKYYRGGLREGAVAAYEMAKRYLPAGVTKGQFITDALAEVNSLLSLLDAENGKGKPESEDEDGE